MSLVCNLMCLVHDSYIISVLQVLAIEFIALAIEFVTLAIEFVTLAIEFITLAQNVVIFEAI